MEDNLISQLELAEKSLSDLQNNNHQSIDESEGSLLRLSSALKNIDKEVNKLRNIMNVDLNTSR